MPFTSHLPPPTVFYPSIPSFVVEAIDKCLQANIADRFSSVKELQDALDPQKQATTSHKPTAKKYRKIEVSNKNITIKTRYQNLFCIEIRYRCSTQHISTKMS